MFSLNGTLKKSGLVGRWETKQFIGMALYHLTPYLHPVFLWRLRYLHRQKGSTLNIVFVHFNKLQLLHPIFSYFSLIIDE